MSDSLYSTVQKRCKHGQDRQMCTDVCPRSALDFRGRNLSWGATVKYPVARHENTHRTHTHTFTHTHTHNSRQAEKCIKGDFIEIKDLVPTKCSNAKAFKVHFRMVSSFVVDI